MRGLTLLEVLVSLGLIAVAILAMMLLFGKGLQLTSQSEELTRASELARRVLETVRAEGGYIAVPPGRTFDARLGDSPMDVVVSPNGSKIKFPPAPYPEVTIEGRRYQFVVRTAADGPGVKAVVVEVWWDERGRAVLETAFSL